jgi:hypothetical protein
MTAASYLLRTLRTRSRKWSESHEKYVDPRLGDGGNDCDAGAGPRAVERQGE